MWEKLFSFLNYNLLWWHKKSLHFHMLVKVHCILLKTSQYFFVFNKIMLSPQQSKIYICIKMIYILLCKRGNVTFLKRFKGHTLQVSIWRENFSLFKWYVKMMTENLFNLKCLSNCPDFNEGTSVLLRDSICERAFYFCK